MGLVLLQGPFDDTQEVLLVFNSTECLSGAIVMNILCAGLMMLLMCKTFAKTGYISALVIISIVVATANVVLQSEAMTMVSGEYERLMMCVCVYSGASFIAIVISLMVLLKWHILIYQ